MYKIVDLQCVGCNSEWEATLDWDIDLKQFREVAACPKCGCKEYKQKLAPIKERNESWKDWA